MITDYSRKLQEIDRIQDKIHNLKEILDTDEPAEIGEKRLLSLTQKWREILNKNWKGLGCEEQTFLIEATKYLGKKAVYLMNYRRVEGAPKTNNEHEQRYHRIKYKLRRTIGHVAAKHYLQKHGNSILFVNPDATEAEIFEILQNAPIQEARKRIRENRKPRNSLEQCVYDQEKWDEEMAKLKKECEDFYHLKKGLL